MQRLPSIRDIAAACGYSKSTVSLVLRNSPAIPEATRRKVLAAAEKLGYRHDPVVADLAARRWRSREGANRLSLAYLYDFTGTGLSIPGGDRYFDEARAAAASYGYALDPFDLSPFETHERASRVLRTRNYRGLLVGRVMNADARLDLQWDRFAATSCSCGTVRPPVHMVETDFFADMQIAWRKAREAGHRRIGYVHLFTYNTEREEPQRFGAYHLGQQELAVRYRIPPCTCSYGDRALMETWLRKQKPSLVIGYNDTVHWWLTELGHNMPASISFISLSTDARREGEIDGLLPQRGAVARAAVELLISQIHLNRRGIPDPIQTIRIPPKWVDGATLGAPAAPYSS